MRRRFVAAREAAGLQPLRFHDLRHTFGSLAIKRASIVQVECPRFRGHLIACAVRRGRKDGRGAQDQAAVSGGLQA